MALSRLLNASQVASIGSFPLDVFLATFTQASQALSVSELNGLPLMFNEEEMQCMM